SFAVDAIMIHPNRMALVLSLALALSCLGFLPFNFRPAKPAAIFMGDAGSQMLGFALATLGLVSSWKVAGTTVATMLVPLLVLAVPILDTTLVTIVRLLEGRPITRALIVHRRRLVEVVIDFCLTVAGFVAAYFLLIGHSDTPYVRHVATVAVAATLFARYLAFIPFGLYRGVWRYAGARDAANVI